MTNALTFTLNLQNAGFQGPGAESIGTLNNIGAAAANANKQLLQLQSGLVIKNNAAGLAASAASQLRAGTFVVMDAAAKVNDAHTSNSINALKSAKAIGALSNTLSMVGFQVAPEATSALHILVGGFKSVKLGASALGLGMGSMSLVVVAAAASLATLTEAIKTFKAEAEADESFKRVLKQGEDFKTKNIDQASRLNRFGYMSGNDLIKVQNLLNDTSGGGPALNGNDKRARGIIDAAQKKEEAAIAAAAFKSQLDTFKEQLLPEADQKRLRIGREIDNIVGPLSLLAEKAGIDPSGLFAAASALQQKRLGELNATQPSQFTLPVTNLERMGGVFNGGLSGPDHARKTADNTAKTVTVLTQIKDKLVSGQTFLAE